MIRISYGKDESAHVWSGEPVAGSDGMRLFRRCAALIASERLHTRLGNPIEAASALAAHPDGDAVLLATFAGWERDGHPVTRAFLATLATPEAILEPWLVCVEAWGRLGFFGPAVLAGLLAHDARRVG
jgi:hypothetical protein